MATRRPTISDVARSAGVSKGAVSFALNDRPGVAPETRDRILAAAAELGWTPSHRARALAASRALAVGLVIGGRRRRSAPTRSSRLHRRHRVDAVAARAVPAPAGRARPRARARRLPEAGRRRPRRRRVPHRPAGRRPASRPPRRARPAGRLIAPSCTTTRAARASRVDDRPGIVAAVEPPGGPRPPGHRPRRRAGRVRALASPAGRPGPVRCTTPGLPEGPLRPVRLLGPGRRATPPRRLLDLPEPPTAIVYANDLMAIAGMAVAASRGLDVPRRPVHHRLRRHRGQRAPPAAAHHRPHRCLRLGTAQQQSA